MAENISDDLTDVTERSKTYAGDEQYMVKEDEHINHLKGHHVDELANLVDGVCNWHIVAEKLGLTDDEIRTVETGAATVVDPTIPAVRYVPTVVVLRLWCKKYRSTVRVLRELFATLGSDQLVQELDDRRMMLVTLSLMVRRDGRPGEFLTPTCPARKPLIDVCRPLLNRKLDQTSVARGDHVVVKLDVTKAPDDIDWTSPAHRFVGQQWTITYATLRLPTQGSQTGPRFKDLRLFDSPQRNAITWTSDDMFTFEYTSDAATAAPADDADATSPKSNRSSSPGDDEQIVFENSDVEESGRDTEAAAAVNVKPQRPVSSVSPLLCHGTEDTEQDTIVMFPPRGDKDTDI